MFLVFLILLGIGLIILLVYLLKKFKHPRQDTINLISGAVGGGKTSSAMCRVKALLRRFYFIWRNRNLDHDYIILSNFPIGKLSRSKDYRYLSIWGHRIRCYDLSMGVLLETEKLPQDEVILIIDEFSSIASQFDSQNPNVKNNIDDFFRFFRHYTNGKGYVFGIDQCSQNIFYQVRRRSSYCYNMISSHKLRFLPIMIFEYRKILLSDEVENVVNVDGEYESDIKKFIFFCNPFKLYDSYAFHDRYNKIQDYTILKFNYVSLKREDVLRVPSTPTYYAVLECDHITKEQFMADNLKHLKV